MTKSATGLQLYWNMGKKIDKCCICGKSEPEMKIKHSVIASLPFAFCKEHEDVFISQDLTGEVFFSRILNGKVIDMNPNNKRKHD